jgi:polar amino acid transport system substrate-binding protein
VAAPATRDEQRGPSRAVVRTGTTGTSRPAPPSKARAPRVPGTAGTSAAGRERVVTGMIAGLAALLAVLAGCGSVTAPLPAQAGPLPVASPTAAPGTPSTPLTPPPTPPTPSPLTTSPPSACEAFEGSLRPAAGSPGSGPGPGPAVAAIARRGYLRVGVRADAAPFGSLDPATGRFAGFEVDLANQVGRALFGRDGRVRLRAVTPSQALDLVRRGELDVAAAGLTVTCAHTAAVDLSEPYFSTAPAALVARASFYRQLADLRGHRVCATADGTTMPADCLVALQNGDVDAVTGDETTLVGLATQDPATHIVGLTTRRTTQVAMAVSTSAPDLTRLVNAVLAAGKRDGTWAGTYARWLRAWPPAPPVADYRD